MSDTAAESTQRPWDDIGYITSSTARQGVLVAVADQPKTPTTIADETGLNRSQVSRAARRLTDRDYLTLLVDQDIQKGRIYGLTETGQQIARHVIEISNHDQTVKGIDDTLDWNTIGMLEASRYRRGILEEAADRGGATPKALTEATGFEFAQVSTALKDLRELGLVELLVDDDRQKGRYHGVTDRGHELLAVVKERDA